MPSERAQILALLATRRIDIAEAERLLALVGGRDRFLYFSLWTLLVLAATAVNPLQGHQGEGVLAALHSALQTVTGSAAFHHAHVFFYRLLGELP